MNLFNIVNALYPFVQGPLPGHAGDISIGAKQIYIPGMQRGRVYIPGMKQGKVYLPGMQRGQVTT